MNKEKIVRISKAVELGLICQKNDDGIIEVINTRGLQIREVPEITDYHDDEIEWIPSGLNSPNKWRLK